jgi:hypothetical protein
MTPTSHHPSLQFVERLQRTGQHERAIRIFARSLFCMLLARGYESRHVIQLSSELLHHVTRSVRDARKDTEAALACPEEREAAG